jgi:hypothetical protein
MKMLATIRRLCGRAFRAYPAVAFGEYDVRVEAMKGLRVAKLRFIRRETPEADTAGTEGGVQVGKSDSV